MRKTRPGTGPSIGASTEAGARVDLSVVVVNYNSGRWLRECLRSLRRWVRDVPFEVLVVDNGSTDGSLDDLERAYPDVQFVQNGENVGFAAAANRGIRRARGRYVLMMNPDVLLLNDGMADWLAFMDRHPEIGISGPKVYDDETRKSVQLSCRGFPSVWNYLFSRYSPLTKLFPNNRYAREFLMHDWDHDGVREVDWVSGCCMLVRRELLEQLGGFDEGYWLFFEDVDLCWRAWQAGWKVVYYPGLEVAHPVGTVRAQVPLKTLVARHKSLWRFYRKTYGPAHPSPVWGLIFLGIWVRLGFLALLWLGKQLGPLVLDALMLLASVALAYVVRGLWEFPWFERAVRSYLQIAPWYLPLQLFLLYVFDLYPYGRRGRLQYEDYLDVLPRVIKAVSLGSLLLVFIAFFGRVFTLPRGIVVLSWLFSIGLLAGWRWAALHRGRKGKPPKRVLIYGTGPLASIVEQELRRRTALGYEPVGFVRPQTSAGSGSPPLVEPVLGGLEDLPRLLQERRIDEIVFAPDADWERELQWLLCSCVSSAVAVNTRLAPELFEIVTGYLHPEHLKAPLVEPVDLSARGGYLVFKRGFDVVVGGLLLGLALPVMGLIALGIRLSSPGPVLFRQRRVGLHGREFTLYKFRTLREPSASDEDLLEENLDRMTPFGRFLRLTRLDELPQLFNVLRGEMSLVGPRAEWAALARRMEREIPHFRLRYQVRPGMTGWAQVQYKYTTSVAEYRVKLQYDLYYIKNLSFSLDLKILLKTLWVVLTGQGAR